MYSFMMDGGKEKKTAKRGRRRVLRIEKSNIFKDLFTLQS